MVSNIDFIECADNGLFNSNLFPEAMQLPVGNLHGLISSVQQTGVRLSTLLDKAGAYLNAKWILTEDIDAAGLSRSISMEKAVDDVIITFY